MAARVRVTHRTDTRGTVNVDYRGLYEITAIEDAFKAGISANLLHPAGWSGDEGDLTGLFAEQIYRVGEANWTALDAIEQLSAPINLMQQTCRGLGVDPKAAIPYGMARFKRQLHEARKLNAARQSGELCDSPLPPDTLGSDWPQW